VPAFFEIAKGRPRIEAAPVGWDDMLAFGFADREDATTMNAVTRKVSALK
jgi:hypothetical protein